MLQLTLALVRLANAVWRFLRLWQLSQLLAHLLHALNLEWQISKLAMAPKVLTWAH
jgi:hypothetical protein